MLTEDAVLKRRLLSVLWKDYASQGFALESLCSLFGILIPLQHQVTAGSDDSGDQTFLCPALLKECPRLEAPPATSLQVYMVFSTHHLIHHKGFVKLADTTGRFVPVGLFSRIVGEAIRWSQGPSSRRHQVRGGPI